VLHGVIVVTVGMLRRSLRVFRFVAPQQRALCTEANLGALSTLAIVGRPNVGKSTLFNKLIGERRAIVHNTPGVTRDWQEGTCEIFGVPFRVTDTAGLQEEQPGDAIAATMAAVTERVVATADIVLMLIDGREGICSDDYRVAKWLRPLRRGRPVLLAASKCEGGAGEENMAEATRLGLGVAVPISAEHNEGLGDLARLISPHLKDVSEEDAANEITLAIVGQPNVGKSTLLNRLVQDERVIVGPTPGLTRESIAVNWRMEDGTAITLLDTAGLHRRAAIKDSRLELLSAWDTERSIANAQVVLLLTDVEVPMNRRDLATAGKVLEAGRPLLIGVNKADTLPPDWQRKWNVVKKHVEENLQSNLAQVRDIEVCVMSAEKGKGTSDLLSRVVEVHRRWVKRVSTGQLNNWLQRTQAQPVVGSLPRGVRLKFITQTNIRPPTFVLFYSGTSDIPNAYSRRLVSALCEEFEFGSVPIRLHTRRQERGTGRRQRKGYKGQQGGGASPGLGQAF